ncbi:MAG: DUF3237 domain-containing protein [Thiolinea sp.]
MNPPALTLPLFCTLDVQLGPIIDLGSGRNGLRKIIPITGGRVSGKVSGEILNLGADWHTVLQDGTSELQARYAFRTDDGALIEIRNNGYRHGPPDVIAALAAGETVDPDLYYMRTHTRFESGDVRYQWLNNRLFIGSGSRHPEAVRFAIYAIE